MITSIGLSSTNQFAGKLNFQDCVRYDFMFFSSEKEQKTIEKKAEQQHLYGKDRDQDWDKLDELDELDELEEIDYMLY
jgi:hypothetical protein